MENNEEKAAKLYTFDDLEHNPHPAALEGVDGTLAQMDFDNGFGVSVIRASFSYGGDEGLYELAVKDDSGYIRYDTPVTNYVLGHLTPEGVTEAMIAVQKLPPRNLDG